MEELICLPGTIRSCCSTLEASGLITKSRTDTHTGGERERREWGNWAKMDLWTYSAESRATTVKVILLSNPTLTTAASLVSNLLFGL